jgi:hypothetical protein
MEVDEPQTTTTSIPTPPEIKLVNVPITDENSAFNLLLNFLNLAQQRGAFKLDESAKIWECIKKFQK